MTSPGSPAPAITGAITTPGIRWARLTAPTFLAAAVAVSLVVVVAAAPPSTGVSPFVVRVAELALAGGAAYLLDDAAAAVTVATPLSLWRRRAPIVAIGVGALALTWVCILAVLRWQHSDLPTAKASFETGVLCCLALSAAAVLAWRGETEPGNLIAPSVLLLGVAVMPLAPAFHVTIFATEGAIGGLERELAWAAAGLVSILVLLAASRDPARR